MRWILHLLGTKIAVFGSLVRNRWAMTAFFGGVLVLKRIGNIVFGAGVLGMWLVVPWARGDVTLSTLLSFDGANGSEPWGGLVQGRDGSFYGTTSFGGAYGSGTVFRMTPTGTLTTLHSFGPDSDGAVPQAGLTLGTDGLLYGTTRDAPPYRGTVFKITTNGVLTTLVRFNGNDGASPWNGALVQGSDGSFFGMTSQGGNTNTYPFGYGTVFMITQNGLFTTLHFFDHTTGDTPYGGLAEGVNGNFYGTTSSGGRLLGGTVFKLTPSGLHTELASFSYRGTNGLDPFSALLQGRDGDFYGTTTQGGASYGDPTSVNGEGFGTVFKITTGGELTTLFSFHGTNGAYPYASLTEGVDGNFYGVTLSGGAFTNQLFPGSGGYAGYGTAFRITTNGVFTSLTSFAGTNGAEVLGNLTLGKDGHFYGTTIRGGAYDLGTVFRLDVSSAPTITCPPSAAVECGNPVEVRVRVNDLDGDPLTVVWELNGEPVQTNTVPAESPTTQADVSLLAELPVGTNLITVAVADSAANTGSCSTEIRVVDTTPPVMLALTAKPNALWPPDHRMVVVNLSAVVVDGCSATTWKITGVRSNEPVHGRGAGKASADWTIIDDHTLQLRAERSGLGADRVYTIEVQASDDAGNLSEPRTLTVRVPKRSLHQPHTHHGVGPGERG